MSDVWWSTPEGVQSVLREEIKIRQARIEELQAKLEKLERWQAAAFIAHSNLDLDIEANPEAIAELKGQHHD